MCALPLVLLASPDYLRTAGVPGTVESLAQHRSAGVRLSSGPPTPWVFKLPDGSRAEHPPQAQLTVNDLEALVDLALAGAGIVQGGLTHALPHLRSGALQLVMPDLHDPGVREVVVHYPHRRYLAPRVRVVVDALMAHFAACADMHLGVDGVLRDLASTQ